MTTLAVGFLGYDCGLVCFPLAKITVHIAKGHHEKQLLFQQNLRLFLATPRHSAWHFATAAGESAKVSDAGEAVTAHSLAEAAKAMYTE